VVLRPITGHDLSILEVSSPDICHVVLPHLLFTPYTEELSPPPNYLSKLSVMKQHEINVQNFGMLQYRQYEQSNMVWLLHLIHIRLNSPRFNNAAFLALV